MIELRVIVGAVFLAVFIIVAIWASFASMQMTEEVNRRLREEEKLSLYFDYAGKLLKTLRLHREYYPDSTRRRHLGILMVVGLGCLLVAALCIVRFR